jgi:hypothetical protein
MSMSNTAKNLLVVLGVITVAFAGYYFLIQDSSIVLRTPGSERELEQMLVRTQEFVGHREVLDSIDLDTSVLQSNEFRNLQSFSPEPNEFPSGRTNPFIDSELERPLVNTVVDNQLLPPDQQ